MKAMSTTNRATAKLWNESCTYVVLSQCGAPVLTIDDTSTSVGNWKLYVTEYTLDKVMSPYAAALVGNGVEAYYYPGNNQLSKFPAPSAAQPDDELGQISYEVFLIDGTTPSSIKRNVPGLSIKFWIDEFIATYAAWGTKKVAYETEAAKWKTYAEYKPIAMGVLDYITGKTDPKQPKLVVKPIWPE